MYLLNSSIPCPVLARSQLKEYSQCTCANLIWIRSSILQHAQLKPFITNLIRNGVQIFKCECSVLRILDSYEAKTVQISNSWFLLFLPYNLQVSLKQLRKVNLEFYKVRSQQFVIWLHNIQMLLELSMLQKNMIRQT